MKISIVMQSYLGIYPGSRDNSDKKFLRAVQSFIDQTDKESELIIVSDGCAITHDLYYKHFKLDDRIKYAYVDKSVPNMYEGTENKYYRGLPRQVGRSLANGEITTYMDSDDFLISDYVKKLKDIWQKNMECSWLINQSWYDDQSRKENPLPNERSRFQDPSNEPLIQIEGLDSLWYAVKGVNGCIPMQPWVLSHKSNCVTKWEDCINIGISEDVLFNRKIRASYPKGSVYMMPMYVRCHYSNRWDY
jgi:hypothetical protein